MGTADTLDSIMQYETGPTTRLTIGLRLLIGGRAKIIPGREFRTGASSSHFEVRLPERSSFPGPQVKIKSPELDTLSIANGRLMFTCRTGNEKHR